MSREYAVSVFASATSKGMSSERSLTFDAFTRLMGHQVTEDKHSVKFIVPSKFIMNDPHPNMCPHTGELLLGRRGVNVDHVSMVQVDYDSGVSVLDIINKYKGITNLVVTSHGHTSAHNKFHAYFPLSDVIMGSEYSACRKSLVKFFPDADPAGFSIAQGFYLPSCPASRLGEAVKSISVTDKLLSGHIFKRAYRDPPQTVKEVSSVTLSESDSARLSKWFMIDYPSGKWYLGRDDHPDLIMGIRGIGGSSSDYVMIASHLRQHGSRDEYLSAWRSIDGVGGWGLLIKLRDRILKSIRECRYGKT